MVIKMKQEEVERSIIKTYRKDIWRNFTKAITEYDLIKENDKIAVCISGGKDSFLLAKCMQEIKKHGRINFELEFIVMDPGYDKSSIKKIEKNAKLIGVPIKIYHSKIFESLTSMKAKSPCYMCARMRRGHLYNYAKELGCNKIALGHHFNDVIETILMGILYNGEIVSMLPKIKSKNFLGLELIRPLYLVRESAIINWTKYNELEFINCFCPLKKEDSKRYEIKMLIKKLKENNKFVEYNLFKSVENININQVMGYIKDNKRYNYYDNYK